MYFFLFGLQGTWKDDSDDDCANKDVSDEEADMLPSMPNKAKLRKCGFCGLKVVI